MKKSERKRVRGELSNRIPPFIFEGEIPDPKSWPFRSDVKVNHNAHANNGEILKGFGGCPGVAEGTAKVITDPSDPKDLGPGNILIAPLTDPFMDTIICSCRCCCSQRRWSDEPCSNRFKRIRHALRCCRERRYENYQRWYKNKSQWCDG